MSKRLKFVVEQRVLFMVRRQTWQARRFEIFESARHFRTESGRQDWQTNATTTLVSYLCYLLIAVGRVKLCISENMRLWMMVWIGSIRVFSLTALSTRRVAALFCGDVDCSDVYTQTDDVASPCPADSFRPAPLVSQDGCCVIHQRSLFLLIW